MKTFRNLPSSKNYMASGHAAGVNCSSPFCGMCRTDEGYLLPKSSDATPHSDSDDDLQQAASELTLIYQRDPRFKRARSPVNNPYDSDAEAEDGVPTGTFEDLSDTKSQDDSLLAASQASDAEMEAEDSSGVQHAREGERPPRKHRRGMNKVLKEQPPSNTTHWMLTANLPNFYRDHLALHAYSKAMLDAMAEPIKQDYIKDCLNDAETLATMLEDYIPTNWKVWKFDPPRVKFMCGQLEVGSQGNIHWQVYMILFKGQKLNWVQKNTAPGVHAEPRKAGTPEECKAYCTKDITDDGSIVCPDTRFALGVFDTNPGKRSDIEHAHSLLKSGQNVLQTVDAIPAALRYISNLEKYQNLKRSRDALTAPVIDTKIIWLSGSAGAGKTRFARDLALQMYPDCAAPIAIVNLSDTSEFLDPYDCNPVVLLDEFRFTKTFTFERLLTLTGKNKGQTVNIKSEKHKPWTVEYLLIARNLPFFSDDGIFELAQLSREHEHAIARRTHLIRHFEMERKEEDPRVKLRAKMATIHSHEDEHVPANRILSGLACQSMSDSEPASSPERQPSSQPSLQDDKH